MDNGVFPVKTEVPEGDLVTSPGTVGEVDRRGLAGRIALPDIVFVIDIKIPVVLQPAHAAMRRRVIRMVVLFVIQRHADRGGNVMDSTGRDLIAVIVPFLPVIPYDKLPAGRQIPAAPDLIADQLARTVGDIDQVEIFKPALFPLVPDAVFLVAHAKRILSHPLLTRLDGLTAVIGQENEAVAAL